MKQHGAQGWGEISQREVLGFREGHTLARAIVRLVVSWPRWPLVLILSAALYVGTSTFLGWALTWPSALLYLAIMSAALLVALPVVYAVAWMVPRAGRTLWTLTQPGTGAQAFLETRRRKDGTLFVGNFVAWPSGTGVGRELATGLLAHADREGVTLVVRPRTKWLEVQFRQGGFAKDDSWRWWRRYLRRPPA